MKKKKVLFLSFAFNEAEKKALEFNKMFDTKKFLLLLLLFLTSDFFFSFCYFFHRKQNAKNITNQKCQAQAEITSLNVFFLFIFVFCWFSIWSLCRQFVCVCDFITVNTKHNIVISMRTKKC